MTQHPFSDQRQRALYWSFFLIILVTGLFLRFQQIGIQWLTDDEWHSVHKLVNSDGYAPILMSLGRADYSIPLTVIYKMMAETIGLSELRMRMPMLLAGVLFLAVAMHWVKSRISIGTALVFGFLIAISPLLVNYSRNARPYMLTLLLAGLALWALTNWANHGKRQHASIYLSCVWLASWMHLIMAPFMLGMLLPLYLRRLSVTRGSVPGWLALISISLLAVAGIFALNLPPLLSDPGAMSAKTGSDLPNFATLQGVFHVWLGSQSAVIVLIGIALAIKGFVRVRHALPLEIGIWSSGLLAILIGILVMQPAWVQNPLTFGRYLLPALPLLLLLIAAGIEDVSRLAASGAVRVSLALCLSAAFLIGTPHAALLSRPNNFTLHSYFQFDYRPAHNPVVQSFLPFSLPSAFWKELGRQPPESLVVAIAGQPSFESYFLLHPLYQPLHRQLLVNLQLGGICGTNQLGEARPSSGIYLRNAASLNSPIDTLRQQVDWVVLEYRQLQSNPDQVPQNYRDFIRQCSIELATRFGKPDYADDYLIAFRMRHEKSLR